MCIDPAARIYKLHVLFSGQEWGPKNWLWIALFIHVHCDEASQLTETDTFRADIHWSDRVESGLTEAEWRTYASVI